MSELIAHIMVSRRLDDSSAGSSHTLDVTELALGADRGRGLQLTLDLYSDYVVLDRLEVALLSIALDRWLRRAE